MVDRCLSVISRWRWKRILSGKALYCSTVASHFILLKIPESWATALGLGVLGVGRRVVVTGRGDEQGYRSFHWIRDPVVDWSVASLSWTGSWVVRARLRRWASLFFAWYSRSGGLESLTFTLYHWSMAARDLALHCEQIYHYAEMDSHCLPASVPLPVHRQAVPHICIPCRTASFQEVTLDNCWRNSNIDGSQFASLLYVVVTCTTCCRVLNACRPFPNVRWDRRTIEQSRHAFKTCSVLIRRESRIIRLRSLSFNLSILVGLPEV